MTTESQTYQTPTSETRAVEALTKAEILTALSKRLGCSEENLGFLFEPPSQNFDFEIDLKIPEIRIGHRAA